MKYYSEQLKTIFNSEKELLEAEAKAAFTGCKCEDTKNTCTENDSSVKTKVPTKKQLAADVDAAETEVKKSYANYEIAKQKVSELSKKYLKEIDEILEPARKEIKTAEMKKYEAICKFNENYGAYQVVYTGDRAADEMAKALKEINRIHRSFFDKEFLF